jgi:short-subunit dehydrogenase
MEFNLYLILYSFIIYTIFIFFRYVARKIRLSSQKQFYLRNKTFLITGGCQGIGKEIIKILVLEYKCKIVNIDIRNNLFEELSQIDSTRIVNFRCDLSNLDELVSTCQDIFKNFDKIDFLINNAGIANNTKFEDLKEEEITKLMNINLLAPMKLCKLFTNFYLKEKKNKIHIITMASVMSHIIADKSSDYISSKWGLYSFHEAMRYDYYYNTNIGFTVICPFAVKTGMFPGFCPPLPFIKLLEVEEVARATVESIILKDKILFIPFYVEFICIIFNFLPCFLRDSLYFSLSIFSF